MVPFWVGSYKIDTPGLSTSAQATGVSTDYSTRHTSLTSRTVSNQVVVLSFNFL